jgi:CO/xanthine dehydrogenase FAD-binding subunit
MSRSLVVADQLDEVLAALASGARPVAGGTDLVVGARQGKKPLPDAIVAIHRIGELRFIREVGTETHIGALATHGDIVANDAIRANYTGIADASAIVGSHATRATGTIGGNVMTASPAMDTGAPLLCLDARVVLQSASGKREVPINEFFVGPGRTVATPDELLVGIALPQPQPNSGSCYVRLEYRQQMEIAIVGAAAYVRFDGNAIVDARVAITAVAPTIRRVPSAEHALVGSLGTADAIATASQSAGIESAPISDVRGSAQYRRAMIEVIVRRCIDGAIQRAQNHDVSIPATSVLK